MSASETGKPTPEPGDADTTEVETPQEAPAPFERPSEQPAPVEAPPDEPPADSSPAFGSRPAAFSSPVPPVEPPPADTAAGESAADRPEVRVGAAFAGGLVLALILKRLGG